MPRRAIVIVLDGCGAGAAPDAAEFGDDERSNTLANVWNVAGPIDAPLLQSSGFLASAGQSPQDPNLGGLPARFGRLQPLSKGGKDSVTGHWEMMGITLPTPFPTYPNGFPIPLIRAFEDRIGTQTIGNRPASGTAIIAELGHLHHETGFPIVYTSADSVFQIACHEAVVPIEKLYEYCRVARDLCVAPNNVQRVIARPFADDGHGGFVRTERRRDFPVEPPMNLLDVIAEVHGIGVVPELFAGRGFLVAPRTQSNPEHETALLNALQGAARFIFANFEDFDMLYGHRNDPEGFARCLEQFDRFLARLVERQSPEDLLILTADHGNDPTTPSTDHSREYVPYVVAGTSVTPGNGGDVEGFGAVGATVARHLGVEWPYGRSLA